MLFLILGLFFAGASVLGADAAGDGNRAILEALKSMPSGGAYAASEAANDALGTAINLRGEGLAVDVRRASPSSCSSATYLVFLRAIEQLRTRGQLPLSTATLESLLVHRQRDGEGVWGRWNANGPGTARLFFELGLGSNFTEFSKARPGDFLKIFWTPEIGRYERGHSVIFLGLETVGGVEQVRFWSSNQGQGFGIKAVPRAQIVRAVFSRLEVPGNLNRAPGMRGCDEYLGGLLSVRSSPGELARQCGLPAP